MPRPLWLSVRRGTSATSGKLPEDRYPAVNHLAGRTTFLGWKSDPCYGPCHARPSSPGSAEPTPSRLLHRHRTATFAPTAIRPRPNEPSQLPDFPGYALPNEPMLHAAKRTRRSDERRNARTNSVAAQTNPRAEPPPTLPPPRCHLCCRRRLHALLTRPAPPPPSPGLPAPWPPTPSSRSSAAACASP